MRKIILLFLTLILVSAIAYLGYSILKKDKQKGIIQEQISQIPDFTLKDTEGNFHSLEKRAADRATLLMYFNSSCEICQMELSSISKRITEFEAYNLIFVTVEPLEEILGFIKELGLGSSENVHFLIDSEMEVAGYYGVKGVPALFLYNSAGSLVENYTGPLKIDLILEKLNQGRETTP
ncbi:peroxiredoxin [Algoriphagus sp. 4150]|uniref:peroxiredoxin family protein n=1 Tax=Algoriphagus sp. 4150 TaxID=2817756 RepID=UPI0028620AA6|nr:TlpA disulfide reductase family protein [Algoriphagus sp. 4150]MDR7129065.1 peroxiredoxin [Algoriphagus sp. 4150]